ncbi:MAG: transposase [Vicinamibacterales bacterium]
MRTPILIAGLLILTTAVWAQARLPEELLAARRVFIAQHSGNRGAFEEVAKRVTEWGRLVIVGSRDQADVVFNIEEGGGGGAVAVPLGGGAMYAVSGTGVSLVVTSPTAPDPLVLDEGKTVGAVARELDLTPSALGGWVRQARAERTKGKSGLMKEEREELTRLRKENRELRLERDLLKKVSALFAKDQR